MEDGQYPQLVLPHVGAMARVATALVGHVSAEDAVQEALLRAWRGWADLREESAVRSWLLRITVNVCQNWRVSSFGSYQRHTASLPATEAPAQKQFITDIGPGTSLHASSIDLRQALTKLDEEMRYVIILRYYGGMDATEIGNALHRPAATVRTQLRRALLRLRAIMDQADQTIPVDQTNQPGQADQTDQTPFAYRSPDTSGIYLV